MRRAAPRRRSASASSTVGWEPKAGLEVLEKVLSQTSGPADVRYYQDRWITLRCANTVLYQPHAEEVTSLSLRVATPEGRLGVATTSDLSSAGLAALVQAAQSMARVAPPVSGFPGFPPDPKGATVPAPFARGVLEEDLERHGQEIADAFGEVQEELGPARISGVYNAGASLLAVANTSGLRRSSLRSSVQASFLTELPGREPPVSGWAEAAHWDPKKIDLSRLAMEAVAATPRTPPKMARPGTYRVLLSGSALSEMMSFLSWAGLGANAVHEGWSFLVGQERRRLVAPEVVLTDDPRSPAGLPAPIDFEGQPTRPRPVVRDGIFTGPAHDTLTGARGHVPSTANALPPEAPFGELGPIPTHLSMAPGRAGTEELLKELKDGILVTRFHYVRLVHPGKTIITGMTRDGTYRVARGEVVEPVTNLRFTESILTALHGVELVGKASRCYADERGWMAQVLSPVVSGAFTFTSATTF